MQHFAAAHTHPPPPAGTEGATELLVRERPPRRGSPRTPPTLHAARPHQPLLHGSPSIPRRPQPEGAPPPPAAPKSRRDKTSQSPPEGQRRRHGPGVLEGPQARKAKLSTAAPAQQDLPSVLLGPAREAAGGSSGGEARPVHPGHGAGPGGRRSRTPRVRPLPGSGRSPTPVAHRPPSMPPKPRPRAA